MPTRPKVSPTCFPLTHPSKWGANGSAGSRDFFRVAPLRCSLSAPRREDCRTKSLSQTSPKLCSFFPMVLFSSAATVQAVFSSNIGSTPFPFYNIVATIFIVIVVVRFFHFLSAPAVPRENISEKITNYFPGHLLIPKRSQRNQKVQIAFLNMCRVPIPAKQVKQRKPFLSQLLLLTQPQTAVEVQGG